MSLWRSADFSVGPLGQPYVRGTGGTALAVGQVVTGAAVRDIVIGNSVARATYGVRTPDVQRGCHMLQLLDGATWRDAMEADQGDWSFFGITIGVTANRATVLESNIDRVRLALQWDAFDLSTFPGGGVTYYDAINGSLIYSSGGVVARRITSTKLVKTICVNSVDPGYYAGWQSSPLIGAAPHLFDDAVNWENTTIAEIELGTGGGNAVALASTGAIARWPAHADNVDGRWTAAGLQAVGNKFWWPGISDANYLGAAWLTAGLQPAGFPARASAGPYWIADIHYDTTNKPFGKILASRHRQEMGCWLVGTRGGTVAHFNPVRRSPSGVGYEHSSFIGGLVYHANSASAFAAEPTGAFTATMSALGAGLSWPVH